MAKINIEYFEKLSDIDGIEKYQDRLPVFATQEYADYLKGIEEYSFFWFTGTFDSAIQLLIPFAVRKKYTFKNGTFQTSTIYLNSGTDLENEREFLNSIIKIIKKKKMCDWVAQPPNWALFNVYPSNSIFCEFGTYKIDLANKNQEEIYLGIKKDVKRRINKAESENIKIKSGIEYLEDCIKVFTESYKQGNHTLPDESIMRSIKNYLPDNIYISVGYFNNVPQAGNIMFLNKYCSYGMYLGMVANHHSSIGHMLIWQAIKDISKKGVNYFDFVGARINPVPGSKHESIQKFKSHFGGEFKKGFLWKIPISDFKYYIYKMIKKLDFLGGVTNKSGDIIDQELERNKE